MGGEALARDDKKYTPQLPSFIEAHFESIPGVVGICYSRDSKTSYSIWVLTEDREPKTRLEVLRAGWELRKHQPALEVDLYVSPLDNESYDDSFRPPGTTVHLF